MTTPTVTEIRRNGNPVGERMELARYTVPVGERVLYGQRVNGVVRFLPEQPVVVETSSGGSEDSRCCPRRPFRDEACLDEARQTRPDDGRWQVAAAEAARTRRGRTGVRVELARYSVSAGDRVLYGQRVDGVVRLTDVPVEAGGRAYLVERGLEVEGSNANAALQALIADYLCQARVLDAAPMVGRRDNRSAHPDRRRTALSGALESDRCCPAAGASNPSCGPRLPAGSDL